MHVEYLYGKSTPLETSTPHGQNSSASPSNASKPSRPLTSQRAGRRTWTLVTPRRLDIAVKLRLFRHLHRGGDPQSETLYAWHIVKRSGARMQAGVATDAWKRNIGDYLTSAEELYLSMRRFGFDPDHAVPIDTDGELLNGSHRVACALALGIGTIPVVNMPGHIWAPAWDAAWFRAHGLDEGTIAALEASLTQSNAGSTIA